MHLYLFLLHTVKTYYVVLLVLIVDQHDQDYYYHHCWTTPLLEMHSKTKKTRILIPLDISISVIENVFKSSFINVFYTKEYIYFSVTWCSIIDYQNQSSLICLYNYFDFIFVDDIYLKYTLKFDYKNEYREYDSIVASFSLLMIRFNHHNSTLLIFVF